jgi:hypothetical protein
MDVCKGVERPKEKIPLQRMHMIIMKMKEEKEGVKRSKKMAHHIKN